MQLDLTVTRRGDLSKVAQEQMPFAMANAMNRTSEEGQGAARLNVHARLRIRSRQTARFFDRMIKIERRDRATKRKLVAVPIRLEGPREDIKDRKRAVGILLRQQYGGTRYAAPFYLPAPGMRTAFKGVPKSLYPAALRLAERLDPSGATLPALMRGKRRAYVVPGVGIFQRSGRKGRTESDSLWFFKARVTVPKRLQLDEAIERTVRSRFQTNLEGFLRLAIATARVRP